ncbi:MAG: hypothetical protein ACE5D0_04215 [Fidelibacterota bacterium]
MKPIIIVGTITITLSLILYTKGMLQILKKRLITKKLVSLLTIGLVSEIIAVICMSIGSTRPITTPHGLIGLAGILIMISIVWISWKSISTDKKSSTLSPNKYFYYLFAYAIWVIAYLTGVIIGMSRT